MSDEGVLVIAGVPALSTTHVILVGDDVAGTSDSAGVVLRQGLVARYGRAPMVVPTSLWLRSCAMHRRPDNGTSTAPLFLSTSTLQCTLRERVVGVCPVGLQQSS